MSNVIPFNPAQLPAHLQQLVAQYADVNKAAASGTGGGAVPTLRTRGKQFFLYDEGVETPLMVTMAHPQFPGQVMTMPINEVYGVLIHINPGVNKAFYTTGYDPDSDAAAPACWSDDGITPDGGDAVQCGTCAACPQNVFGSAPPRNGTPSKGKACADRKNVALLLLDPADPNDPAKAKMVRLSASTMSIAKSNAQGLGALLSSLGQVPYFAVTVGISFTDAATPILKFRVVGYPQQSVDQLLAMHGSDEAKTLASVKGASGVVPQQVPAPAPQPVAAQIPVQQVQTQPVYQQPAPAQQPVQQPVMQVFQDSAGATPVAAVGQPVYQQPAPTPQAQPQPQDEPNEPSHPLNVATNAAGELYHTHSGRVVGKPRDGGTRRTKVEMEEDKAVEAAGIQPQPAQQVQQAPQQSAQPAAPAGFDMTAIFAGGGQGAAPQPAVQPAPIQQPAPQFQQQGAPMTEAGHPPMVNSLGDGFGEWPEDDA